MRKLKSVQYQGTSMVIDGNLKVLGDFENAGLSQVRAEIEKQSFEGQTEFGDTAAIKQAIADMANDDCITPTEKRELKREWDRIDSEYAIISVTEDVQAQELSDYETAYNRLREILLGDVYTDPDPSDYPFPIFEDMTVKSSGEGLGALIRSRFNTYYDTREALVDGGVQSGEAATGLLPDTPGTLLIRAFQQSIFIEVPWDMAGERNKPKRFLFQVSKDEGQTGTIYSSRSNRWEYVFNRDIDGYPELADLADWRIRAKVENQYGYQSTAWSTYQEIDPYSYTTWLPPQPTVAASISHRTATLQWPAGNQFGFEGYHIQIALKETEPEEGEWLKPDPTLNFNSSESNYQAGAGYYKVTVERFNQSLPLKDQALGLPKGTRYWYRVRGVSNVPTTADPNAEVFGSWSNAVQVYAEPTGTQDIVEAAIKTAQLDDSAVTIEKLNVLALNLVNPLTSETLGDEPEGWTKGASSVSFTIFYDTYIKRKVIACNVTSAGDRIAMSNLFDVMPFEILEVSIGYSSDSGGRFCLQIGEDQQTELSLWNDTTKSWGAFQAAATDNAIINDTTFSGITAFKYFLSYIVGSSVDISKIPAPITPGPNIYCVRMIAGETQTRLDITNGIANKNMRIAVPLVKKIGTGQVTANQIITASIAAISANLGVITGGALTGSALNYWALSRVFESDGVTVKYYEGAMRVGGSTEYLKVVPVVAAGVVTGYTIEFKVGSFSIQSQEAGVNGTFKVYTANGSEQVAEIGSTWMSTPGGNKTYGYAKSAVFVGALATVDSIANDPMTMSYFIGLRFKQENWAGTTPTWGTPINSGAWAIIHMGPYSNTQTISIAASFAGDNIYMKREGVSGAVWREILLAPTVGKPSTVRDDVVFYGDSTISTATFMTWLAAQGYIGSTYIETTLIARQQYDATVVQCTINDTGDIYYPTLYLRHYIVKIIGTTNLFCIEFIPINNSSNMPIFNLSKSGYSYTVPEWRRVLTNDTVQPIYPDAFDLDIFEDFLSSDAGDFKTDSVGLGSIYNAAQSGIHYGVLTFSGGGNSNWYKAITTGSGFTALTTALVFESAFIMQNSGGFSAYLGFHNITIGGPTAHGVAINIASNVLKGATIKSGTASYTGTTYTITNGVWYKIKISFTTSGASFYLYNDSGVQLWSATLPSTNIPTTAVPARVYTGTNAIGSSMSIDYIKLSSGSIGRY